MASLRPCLFYCLCGALALAAGCAQEHPTTTDGGALPVDGGADAGPPRTLDCFGAIAAGASGNGASCDPATFTTPCREHVDFVGGVCGDRQAFCESGHVRFEDHTFGCALDAGPPTAVPCGGATCAAGEVCVTPCSGVDAGPPPPHCAPHPADGDCEGPSGPGGGPNCSACGPGYGFGSYTDPTHIRCTGCA